MDPSSSVSVVPSVSSPDETKLLTQLVENPADSDARLRYASWLEEQGETERAEYLRHLDQVYDSVGSEREGDEDQDEDEEPDSWSRLVGGPLIEGFADIDFPVELRDLWLSFAKPALIYKQEPWAEDLSDTEDPSPVGSTKMFGHPDLPSGSTWPTQKDCNAFYMDDSGIPAETPCGFVCQFNLADFAGTQAGRHFPNQGLLSIFACAELESIGMVDALVLYTEDVEGLERMVPPAELMGEDANEDNRILPVERLSFSETLELPDPDRDSVFEALRESSDEYQDELSWMLEEAGSRELDSLLGYTRCTTGGDPLPGPDWCKLICVETSVEIVLHICIRKEDLAAGRLDQVQLAWVDFG